MKQDVGHKKMPGDVSRLPAGVSGIKLAAAGMLVLLSTSYGFSAGEPRIAMNEVPAAISRDAFVLLGSRTVGIAAGMSAAGVSFEEETNRKITSIAKSLDSIEAGMNVSVWRSIARSFHAEAIGGYWEPDDVDTMADAVLSLHRNVSDIFGSMRVSLVKAGAGDDDAELIAKTALVAIAYGNTGLVGTVSNELRGVISGVDTDMCDFAEVASEICDTAKCQSEPVREAMSAILTDAAGKFRDVIITSLAAAPFVGPTSAVSNAGIQTNPAQDL